MFAAFSKSFAQLPDPTFRKVILMGVLGAFITFLLLFGAVTGFLFDVVLVNIPWVDGLIDWLGSLATIVVVWFLFPAVASVIIGFLLEDIAQAVENKHYPDLPPAEQVPWGETLVEAIKFAGVMILLNLLALPFYLFLAPVAPFVFYALNGYLISREYFELVGQRRVGLKKAKALRKAYQGKLLIAGALTAFLLTIPLVNLLAPVVGTAVMVHLFHSWRREPKFLMLEQQDL
ncbi:EI24 domain-containing protein [Terasakiella sp. A23]|uniref:EI24 domain-containing protein n=1 Tax=Terasakiella sp. FCG-A23 TaxID=3080561 RepID=UPI0029539906|nr:EI24 domain-containing protein [Terasakiella sp. A23]MDV7341688.1 EI24 domain-containing protein [Terasakiella sp. A23]